MRKHALMGALLLLAAACGGRETDLSRSTPLPVARHTTARQAPALTALAILAATPWIVPGVHARTNAASAPPRISVEGVRPLVSDPAPSPLVESFLAVNPVDPENLLVSAMSTSGDRSVLYGSWDGGEAWRLVEGPADAVFPGGDPVLTFDGNGRAYFATLDQGVSVWRSGDGGRTWTGPAVVAGGGAYDRDWLAASTVAGKGVRPLYLAAKRVERRRDGEEHVLVTSVSRDGGVTFASPTIIRTDSGYLHTPVDLLVRNDGTLLLPYLVHYGPAPGGSGRLRGHYWLRLSADGGRSWPERYGLIPTIEYGNAGDLSLMLKGLAAAGLALDETGGAFDGSAYMALPTVVADRIQVVVTRSRDGGQTWTAPIRVNDGGYRSNHSTPMIAVNHDGVVAVTWNDRRDDAEDLCFRHYVAVSGDGGETFGANQVVSERPTCPGARSRWLNGGETQGLAALPDGSFRLVWSVGDGRAMSLWTARVLVR